MHYRLPIGQFFKSYTSSVQLRRSVRAFLSEHYIGMQRLLHAHDPYVVYT